MKKFKNEKGHMEQDLRGNRYGLLVVINTVAVSDRREAGKPEALCQCGCGNTVPVRTDSLKSGNTKSCGCLAEGIQSEAFKAGKKRVDQERITHGLRGHYLYGTWQMMNRRCYVPTTSNYANYGGSGVEVYPPWQKAAGPTAFIEYCERQLGPRPDGYTLDRICPEGDYWPGNIRWASATEQNNNKRGKAA